MEKARKAGLFVFVLVTSAAGVAFVLWMRYHGRTHGWYWPYLFLIAALGVPVLLMLAINGLSAKERARYVESRRSRGDAPRKGAESRIRALQYWKRHPVILLLCCALALAVCGVMISMPPADNGRPDHTLRIMGIVFGSMYAIAIISITALLAAGKWNAVLDGRIRRHETRIAELERPAIGAPRS